MAVPYKQPCSVLVVIHSAEKVLLLERSGPVPGLWQSVTGSREGDEAPEQTALRELAEETGFGPGRPPEMGLEALDLVCRFEIAALWRHRYAPAVAFNTETAYACRLPRPMTPRLNPDEHRGALWLPWREAEGKVFSWTNARAIAQLARRMEWQPCPDEPEGMA